MGHQPDREGVPGVEAFLLHQEVHHLCQTLVIAHPEALHGARLDINMSLNIAIRYKLYL